MKKTVLKFGLISGGLLSALVAITLPLCLAGKIHFRYQELLGYTEMALAFIAVFFGIRSYRENHGGGMITFGRAFKVGILITLITCAVYVIGWEIVYWGFLPDFGDKYAVLHIEMLRQEGASPERLAIEQERMKQFMQLYKNPFFNVGMTFMEVFPVGLIVTLVSAAILRKKAPSVLATA